MKILFVDDQKVRFDLFKTVFSDENFVLEYAKTVSSAIKCLNENDYDLVCLDHDMGEKKSGQDIANHMVKSEKNFPFVWIHSMNVYGSHGIKFILSTSKNVGTMIVIPFNFMTINAVLDAVTSS